MTRMIASRNRRQDSASLDVGIPGELGDSISREWEMMPKAGRDYYALLAANAADPDDSTGASGTGDLADGRLNEGSVGDPEETGDPPGEDVPFYY